MNTIKQYKILMVVSTIVIIVNIARLGLDPEADNIYLNWIALVMLFPVFVISTSVSVIDYKFKRDEQRSAQQVSDQQD